MEPGDVTGGANALVFPDAAGEEDALDDVEPAEFPGLEIALEVRTDEVMIEKSLVLFMLQIGLHNRIEKGGVFSRKEEVQLVRRVLRIKLALFLIP